MKPNWKISALIADAATQDDLTFVLAQAEKKIKEMTDEANILYSRASNLLSISIPLIAGLIAYTSASKQSGHTYSGIVVITMLAIIILKLRSCLKPREYHSAGEVPSNMLQDVFYTELKNKKPIEYILFKQVTEAECKIAVNEQNNKDRANALKKAIDLIYAIPPLVGISYLLHHFLT